MLRRLPSFSLLRLRFYGCGEQPSAPSSLAPSRLFSSGRRRPVALRARVGRRRLTPPPVRPSSFVQRVVAASWPTLAPCGEFTTALFSRPGGGDQSPPAVDPPRRETHLLLLAPAIVLVMHAGGADHDGSLSIALSFRALVHALAAASSAFPRLSCLPSSLAWRRSPWQSSRPPADDVPSW